MTSNKTSNKRTAYDAFASVDELVAKPVLGSDGAALWQAFDVKKKKASVAPKAPLKAADRAAGFRNWDDERQQEEQERQKAGHKSLQESGYTVFKQKGNDDKPIDWTAKRKRSDHVTYYIAAEQFEGPKFDYVFTTRDRGTGYYWDGMDSLKQRAGIAVPRSSSAPAKEQTEQQEEPVTSRKKKSKRAAAPIIRDDPNNPFEQVAAALHRKLQSDWKTANDPATGKTYYYNISTGERSWNPPLLGNSVPTTAQSTTTTNLPNGWQAVQDPASGKEYYYHTETKQTQWERPTA
jgi:hypothetical protein